MNSIINEISRLRKGAPLVIDYKNSNRYRVVTTESNGPKTAYYFTTPIYKNRTRNAVDMKFHTNSGTIYATGSGTNITLSNSIRMENAEGSCVAFLPDRVRLTSDCEAIFGTGRIVPTTNGVAIMSSCIDEGSFSFSIEVSKPFMEVLHERKI